MPEYYKKEIIKKLHVKIQFLKPCNASTTYADVKKKYDKEFALSISDKRPMSPESNIFFQLALFLTAQKDGYFKTKEEELKMYNEIKKTADDLGIDLFEFVNDITNPRFRCNYRTKVFATFFSSSGYEIETYSIIPVALFIDELSKKRKTEMLPGETTYVSFVIPNEATSWQVWLPK